MSTPVSVCFCFFFYVSVGLFISLSAFHVEKENIKLISANSEISKSGTNGGVSSKEYFFKLKILSTEQIEFDSLWMEKKGFKTYVANNKKGITSQAPTFSKNDTVIVRVSDLSRSKMIQGKPPIKFDGSALLRYYINDKTYYLKIKTIKINQTINRQ